MDIKWLHAPGHSHSIGPEVISFATQQSPTIIDWSEMYFNINDLVETATKYNHFIGKPKRTDRRGRVVNHDVILSVDKRHTITHQEEFFVGAEVSRILKYMPERWGKAIVFWVDDQVVLAVAWHPQPGALRWTNLVLPQYRKSVKRVEKKQRELEKTFKPNVVLNGGDLQLFEGRRWVCPNKMGERLGMQWKSHKIDWQLFKGFGLKLVNFTTLDPSKVNRGMDHLWTVLTIRKAN